MAVFNTKFAFSYYAVPKSACTSLKAMAFEIENGFPFRTFTANGSFKHIHLFYPSMNFRLSRQLDKDGQYRFAVVRDPVERFLSAYSNRVLHHDELSPARLANAGAPHHLVPRPAVNVFVDRLGEYRAMSDSILHHTEPQVFFLGLDHAFYNQLFAMGELGELEGFVRERTGLDVHLGHEQRGGRKIDRSVLTEQSIRKLEDFYAKDYQIYGQFF